MMHAMNIVAAVVGYVWLAVVLLCVIFYGLIWFWDWLDDGPGRRARARAARVNLPDEED